MELRVSIIFLVFCKVFATSYGSLCSKANLTANPTDCIMAIREAIVDTDRFWFGSDYTERCAGPNAFTVDCINLLGQGPFSISSLVFFQNTFEVNLITDFLEVEYTSEPGTYTGCGTSVTRDTSQTFRLDPLTQDAYPPWDARSMPKVTWPKQDGKLYTLIVTDVGFGFTHGIFINIDGDLSSPPTAEQTLKPYSGPKNFRRIPNPYLFILFEQTKMMQVESKWISIISNPMMKFNVSDFQEQHQLKGPIAVNWILASYDAYSLAFQFGIVDNCVSLVQDKVAVYHSSRPWLQITRPLSVNVNVTFEVEKIDFKMCCKDFSYPAQTFSLDPLGQHPLLPVETRTGQEVEVKLSMSGPVQGGTRTSFQGKHYTLLMVDPDVPFAIYGTNARPLVHWLAINMVVNSDHEPEGTTIHSYRGPAPPDQKPHTYYYLLYEQSGELTMENSNDYDGNCSTGLTGKCQFDVAKFQMDNNLTLVGVSWMTANNDYYTNYTKTVAGQDSDQFCQWTPGYANPCDPAPANNQNGSSDNAATGPLVSITLLILTGLLVANFKL